MRYESEMFRSQFDSSQIGIVQCFEVIERNKTSILVTYHMISHLILLVDSSFVGVAQSDPLELLFLGLLHLDMPDQEHVVLLLLVIFHLHQDSLAPLVVIVVKCAQRE